MSGVPSRRRQLMRSSSTGSGLDDRLPSHASRFVASVAGRTRRRASIGGGKGRIGSEYGALDDLGVSGVKPRVHFAARASTADDDPDHYSATSGSQGANRRAAAMRRRMSFGNINRFAKKGVQETAAAAGDFAAKLKAGDVMGALTLTNFAMKKITFDERAAWNARLTSPDVQVALKVQGRNFPHRNTRHANSFCVLWEVPNGYTGCGDRTKKTGPPGALPRSQEHEVGRTEVVRDTQNPIFTESFVLNYNFELEQTYLLRVYDEDLGYTQNLSEHYYIGGYVFTLGDLLGRPTQKIITSIDTETEATIVLQSREVAATRKFLEHRISAHGLTTSDMTMSTKDPYYMVERLYDETDWVPVWKSEVVVHDSAHPNPIWETSCLSLVELCDGDLDAAIRITFWESHIHGEDEHLGHAEIKVRDLAFNVPLEGLMVPIRIEKKYFFGVKLQKTGQMQIFKSRLIDRPSFLQYLKGGCELDVIVAVDCEAGIDHRDHSKDTNFEHGAWRNNYQSALEKIGTLMASYSRSHYFQMWGFNATTSLENLEANVFTMNNKVAGKQGLLKTYERTCLRGNKLLGRFSDSHVGPLIIKAMYRAIQENERRHCYSVLILLTSGKQASDLQAIMDSINRAATDSPLSIIFIGCEDNDLSSLKHYFDRNKIQRSISGVRISRECTTFTSFAECGNDASKVVEEAFRDVPEQMVQRFFQGGVKPKVPPKIEPTGMPNVHQKKTKKMDPMIDRSKKSSGSSSSSESPPPRERHSHPQNKKKHHHRSKSPNRRHTHSKSPGRGRNHHKSPDRGRNHHKSPDRGRKMQVKPCDIDF